MYWLVIPPGKSVSKHKLKWHPPKSASLAQVATFGGGVNLTGGEMRTLFSDPKCVQTIFFETTKTNTCYICSHGPIYGLFFKSTEKYVLQK